MKEIEVNKTIVLTFALSPVNNINNAQNFTITNVIFIPDIVIIKNCSWTESKAAASTDSLFIVSSSLFDSDTILSVATFPNAGYLGNSKNFYSGSIYKINNMINGTYNFYFTNPLTQSYSNVNGTLSMTLEFIKFKH